LRYSGITRRAWPGMVSEYAVLKPDGAITTTGPDQIGIGFSGHHGLVREVDGRAERYDAEPGSVYVTGASPITWLDVTEPVEALEIYPDPALVERLAGDSGVSAEVRPSFAIADGVVFSVASRLRRAHLAGGHVAGETLTDTEASTLAHLLVRHMLRGYGTRPGRGRRPAGLLPPGAVGAVGEYIRAHLADEITLDALATAVNLSAFHFARSFAGMRRSEQSAAVRFCYGLGSAVLPIILLGRITRTALRQRRHLGWFLASLPLLLLFLSVGAVGEMVGYLGGAGRSLERVE